MASTIKVKRSAVSGNAPNTSNIDTGELALNTADGILYSSDGSSIFEVGANLTSLSVTGQVTLTNIISANGGVGTAGQALLSDGSSKVYWGTVASGSEGAVGSKEIFYYTAGEGDTTFSGADDYSNVADLDTTYLDVYLNGILISNSNYTSNTTAIVFTSGVSNNDVVTLVASNIIAGELVRTYVYSANGTQTVFSGADLNSQTLTITSNFTDVYVNGLLIYDNTNNYTSNSSAVTFQATLNENDIVTIKTYDIVPGRASLTGIDDNSTAVALTIDSSNRVGINETTPNYNLDVGGSLGVNSLYIGDVQVTATAAEINLLDGLTANTSELNLLDGVTATTTEINYLDGVTSNIQTQIDNISSSFTLAADNGANDTFNTDETLTFTGGTGIDTTVANNEITIAVDSTIAPLASPTFTGTPAAPTAASGTNTTQIATTEFVTTAVANLVDSAPATLDTLNELAAALGDDANYATTTSTALGNRLRVDTASQGLTGTQQTNALTNLGVTATPTELNTLDGITATTAELNYTDGVTSNIQTQLDAKAPLASPTFTGTLTYATLNDGTTNLTATVAELNVLDGITASVSELNILDGVTATTAEINYLSGATSNIQTQIDNISSSFTLAADNGANDTFNTDETLTFTGGTGIDTTVANNVITIAIDSTVGTITSSTGAAIIPSGTTAQRDGSPVAGYLRFNTSDSSFEGYDGSAWGAIGGAGGVNNQKLDDISSGFDGANTDFSLTVSSSAVEPASVNNVLISLNGVIQEPTTTYTISGSTITFTTAPEAGDTFFGLYYGSLSINTPGDGTVGTAQLSSANVAFDTSTLFIDSTNNRVGVKTTSPSAPLTIQGGSTTDATIQLNGGAVGNDNASIHSLYNLNFKADSSEAIAGRSIGFAVGSTTAMRVVSGGKVGIGTNSPLGKLTISNDAGATAPTTVTAANAYLQLGSDDYGLSGAGKFMIGFGYTDATNTNSPAYIGFEESTSSGDTKGSLTFYTRDVITDTAPSERMRITSAGNVGIGTTSPNTPFHLTTAVTTKSVVETTGAVSDALIEFTRGQGTNNTWSIGLDQSNSSALSFAYLSNGSPSLTTHGKVVIDSSGNVGIGTTSPSEKLEVSGAAKVQNVYLGGGGGLAGTIGYSDSSSSIALYSGSHGTTPNIMVFNTNTSERIRITSAGNVGIGTTSPDNSKLHVSGGHINVDNNYGIVWGGGSSRPYIIGNKTSQYIILGNNGTEKMRIDSSGDVGIGTTSPSGYKLHISDSAPTVRISGTAETAGLTQAITFGTPTYNRSTIQSINVGTQGADLAFLTAPSGGSVLERMRITSAGNVGIGTSSPTSILDLRSTDPKITLVRTNNGTSPAASIDFETSDQTVRWQIATNQAVGVGFEINQGSGTNNRLYINPSGNVGIGTTSPAGKFEVYAGTGNTFRAIRSADNDIEIGNYNSTDGYRRTSYGSNEHLFYTGTAGGGSVTERIRIDGDGLKFNGDTAAANALDDYEEGDFTPNLYDGTTTVAQGTDSGSYIKIGNLVFVSIAITTNTTGLSSGNAIYVTGLPFTSRNSKPVWNNLEFRHTGGASYPSSTTDIKATIGNNSTIIAFYATGSAAQTQALVSNIGNNTSIRITGTYYAA